MALHVCILGIDGSGKSTITATLPPAVAAEFRLRAGSAGDAFLVVDPDQDHLAPGFHPEGLGIFPRLARRLKRLAKRVVDNRKLYPAVKLSQMILQDAASWKISQQYRVDVMISDGNALLSAIGRAANYLRPASQQQDASIPGASSEDLVSVFEYVLEGKPIPEGSRSRLPNLKQARRLNRLMKTLRIPAGWLPDAVVFVDLEPEKALDRIARRGKKIDLHENLRDLAQAREMYHRVLEAFAKYHSAGHTIRIPSYEESPGETLAAGVQSLQPLLHSRQQEKGESGLPFGATTTQLTTRSVWSKVLTPRYLFGYLAGHFFRGAWREPLFAFSDSGRLFLREGYSAGVMRVIYDQEVKNYGVWDRVFLNYPLHRAVYDRLTILTRHIERELEARLAEGKEVRIFTAPSGFAYDLLLPLEAIAGRNASAVRRVRVVASDLDPTETLKDELVSRSRKIGVSLEFLRGDLTEETMRTRFANTAPYDIVLFVGLSSWLPKPEIIGHLRWVRKHIRDDGTLFTDCFTTDSYAYSGRYLGYKAQYFSPDVYKILLDYCGFDGLRASVESGRDGINHVLLLGPRARESTSQPSQRDALTHSSDGP